MKWAGGKETGSANTVGAPTKARRVVERQRAHIESEIGSAGRGSERAKLITLITLGALCAGEYRYSITQIAPPFVRGSQ